MTSSGPSTLPEIQNKALNTSWGFWRRLFQSRPSPTARASDPFSAGVSGRVPTETSRAQNPAVCVSPGLGVLCGLLGPEEGQQGNIHVPKSRFQTDRVYHLRCNI